MIESELAKIKLLYEAVSKILKFTKDISKIEELKSNLLVWDAVKINLIVIDEMDSKIDIKTKEEYNEINWSKIKEIQPYVLNPLLGFDIDVIWKVIKKTMPIFKLQLEKIINL